jgi:MSHA pilin protein MshC
VELVLVLVVIGILAGVAGPRFFGRAEFDERLFFDDARSALRYAQKLAVATGCEVRVSIAANAYGLAQQSTCSGGAFDQPVVHPGTGAPSYANTAPAGVALTSDVNPFRFDSLGRARDAGGGTTDVTVTVGTRTLLVEGETGFVRSP